jgi:small subunit ribosomal protein S8e
MPIYHSNDLKKISGGVKRPHRKRRKYELGSFPTETILDVKEKRVAKRARGGNIKIKLRRAVYANVYNPNENKSIKARIIRVEKTPANPDYARRQIIVKGSIIETEIGKAIVTSRPGQDGIINAVLIEEE